MADAAPAAGCVAALAASTATQIAPVPRALQPGSRVRPERRAAPAVAAMAVAAGLPEAGSRITAPACT
ncbi:hypothetical protein AB0H83_50550 [Dactylosporangium sp. NPDC050688]|uniref:hypothetical protein n=1 Tax=Dactylosporangium sp. NPDC050688 TaxID=3157217 RepID=UPI0033ECA65D